LGRQEESFYIIERPRILDATTSAYREFLRDSGYGDLDSCSGIGFAKGILKYDQDVRDAASRAGLSHTGNDGDYVVNINQSDARKLIEALGYKVPTVGLMYRLFIPYIKELAQSENPEAQETLNEMIDTSVGKAEWLEDSVSGRTKLKIGTSERRLSLPKKDGRFDRVDVNELGYPNRIKGSGEFFYWHPRGYGGDAFRFSDHELGLNLNGTPSVWDNRLGVRPSKIFHRK